MKKVELKMSRADQVLKVALKAGGPQELSEIAFECDTHSPVLHGVVQKLIEDGLLERNKIDGVWAYTITEMGIAHTDAPGFGTLHGVSTHDVMAAASRNATEIDAAHSSINGIRSTTYTVSQRPKQDRTVPPAAPATAMDGDLAADGISSAHHSDCDQVMTSQPEVGGMGIGLGAAPHADTDAAQEVPQSEMDHVYRKSEGLETKAPYSGGVITGVTIKNEIDGTTTIEPQLDYSREAAITPDEIHAATTESEWQRRASAWRSAPLRTERQPDKFGIFTSGEMHIHANGNVMMLSKLQVLELRKFVAAIPSKYLD